jgi:hypothetical protein
MFFFFVLSGTFGFTERFTADQVISHEDCDIIFRTQQLHLTQSDSIVTIILLQRDIRVAIGKIANESRYDTCFRKQ